MKLDSLIQTRLPFVIYKKPNSGKLHIIQQNSTELLTDKNFQTEGFYFAPFDFKKHPVIVFPEKNSKKETYFIRNFSMPDTGKIKLKNLQINKQEAEKHQNKIAKAIKFIQRGEVEKVIISRKQEIPYDDFDIFYAVLKLMQNYEHSFVYLWHHPQKGTWLGATPELLLEYYHKQIKTVALAGTLPVKKNEPVSWENKEIKEQEIVTNYITEKLQILTNKLKVGKTHTIYQGNLAHLKTEITAEFAPENINQILLSLHPTPAVCGIPIEKSKHIIDKIENYDRKYYTGFLGYKKQKEGFLYVNLRSTEVLPNKLLIFVGGGILANSQKNKEWEETLQKSKIIMSLFNKNM